MEPREPYRPERRQPDPNQWFTPTWQPPANQQVQKPTNQIPQQPAYSSLPEPPYPTNTAAPISPHNKKSSGKKILLIGIMLVVISIAIVAATLVYLRMQEASLPDAVAVSDRMITAMVDQDAKTAYTLVAEQFKNETSQDELQLIFEQVGPLLGSPTESTLSTIQKSDDGTVRAVVIYELPGNEDDTYYIRVILEKTPDDWRILNFRTDDQPLEAVIE